MPFQALPGALSTYSSVVATLNPKAVTRDVPPFLTVLNRDTSTPYDSPYSGQLV